jgi:4-coumarate--CoA ligase
MAQMVFIDCAIKRQIPVYMMKKFDFIGMLDAIQKYKVTTLNMVPPVVVVCPPTYVHFLDECSWI